MPGLVPHGRRTASSTRQPTDLAHAHPHTRVCAPRAAPHSVRGTLPAAVGAHPGADGRAAKPETPGAVCAVAVGTLGPSAQLRTQARLQLAPQHLSPWGGKRPQPRTPRP